MLPYSTAYRQRDPSAHGSLFIWKSIYLTKPQINKSHSAWWMLQHQWALKWSLDLAIRVNVLVMSQIWHGIPHLQIVIQESPKYLSCAKGWYQGWGDKHKKISCLIYESLMTETQNITSIKKKYFSSLPPPLSLLVK